MQLQCPWQLVQDSELAMRDVLGLALHVAQRLKRKLQYNHHHRQRNQRYRQQYPERFLRDPPQLRISMAGVTLHLDKRRRSPAIHNVGGHARAGQRKLFDKPVRHAFDFDVDALVVDHFLAGVFAAHFDLVVVAAIEDRAGHEFDHRLVFVRLAMRDRQPQRRGSVLRVGLHRLAQIIARVVHHHEQGGEKDDHPQHRDQSD